MLLPPLQLLPARCRGRCGRVTPSHLAALCSTPHSLCSRTEEQDSLVCHQSRISVLVNCRKGCAKALVRRWPRERLAGGGRGRRRGVGAVPRGAAIVIASCSLLAVAPSCRRLRFDEAKRERCGRSQRSRWLEMAWGHVRYRLTYTASLATCQAQIKHCNPYSSTATLPRHPELHRAPDSFSGCRSAQG